MSRRANWVRGPSTCALCAAGFLALLWAAGQSPSHPVRAYTQLHVAARAGDLARVRRLAAGARHGPDPRDGCRVTPLHLAAQAGHLDVVRFLLDSGADPLARDLSGWTALHYAAASYNGDGDAIADALLRHDRSPGGADDQGRTPLHLAAMRGDAKLTRRLLDAGADVNARDDRGDTALHDAGLFDKAEVVEVLVRAGADLKCRDKAGATPLGRAASEKSARAAQVLRRAGATP